MKKKSRVQSVSRACNILELLSFKNEGLTTLEVSQYLDLNRSTAHHLISTLLDHNFVETKTDNKYYIGSFFYEVINQNPRGLLLNFINSILVDIVSNTEETTYFSLFDGGVVPVDSVLGLGALRVVQANPLPGEPQHLHARAAGKIYLSTLSNDELNNYLNNSPLQKLAKKSIVSKPKFLNELERIRNQGYAEDNEEFLDGVICYSHPVKLENEIIGCVSSSLPTARMEKYPEVILAVQESITKFEKLIDKKIYSNLLS
ncbi:IclR family transcriptional regulator [Salinicoccus sp. Marseille-QA3877]